MNEEHQYTVNSRKVVHETIGGETILIHLETGTYYSLAGSASEIWGVLATTGTTDAVVRALRRRYDAAPGEIESAVSRLVEELRGEQLIEPVNGSAPALAEPQVPGEEGPPTPFQPPALEKFTDMQEMLLLDPIHEVEEEAGWPHRPGTPPS